jgi:hypothetical protein
MKSKEEISIEIKNELNKIAGHEVPKRYADEFAHNILKIFQSLPSDDKIYSESGNRYPQIIYNNGEDSIFEEGAKWMRDNLKLNK